MVTINQQRKYFNDFADNHFQIKDFGWGDIPDVSMEEGTQYPLLWVVPSPWTIDENELNFKYTVFCADRAYKEKGLQLTEVHSDTAQILLDLMASMDQQQDYDWELVKQATVTPFTEAWKDEVAGHFIDLTFKVEFNYDECQIPMSGQPAPPASTCAGAVITINTILYGSVASGGSEDIEVRNVAGDLVGSLINGIWVVPNAIVCADATAVLKNSEGTVLSSTDIPSGTSQDIIAPVGDVVIKDTAGNILATESAPSGGSGLSEIADSVAVLKNTLNTIILSENILATATEDITVADVDYTDSDGSPASVPYGTSLICTPASAPSGVLLKWPTGQQYTSFRAGDEGSRVQAGYFNYTPPVTPAAIAELDLSIGANAWLRLKNPLIVGGVSSVIRFVDVNGVQTWGTTDNVDKITIDKLTGIGFYRVQADIDPAAIWNTVIDNALAFSVVVNGVTYDSFYLGSLEERLLLFHHNPTQASGDIWDIITVGNPVIFDQVTSGGESWTSTTQANNTANAYSFGWNNETYIRGVAKAVSFLPFYVFDARSLISAP